LVILNEFTILVSLNPISSNANILLASEYFSEYSSVEDLTSLDVCQYLLRRRPVDRVPDPLLIPDIIPIRGKIQYQSWPIRPVEIPSINHISKQITIAIPILLLVLLVVDCGL
jgi:hypothetical protein